MEDGLVVGFFGGFALRVDQWWVSGCMRERELKSSKVEYDNTSAGMMKHVVKGPHERNKNVMA